MTSSHLVQIPDDLYQRVEQYLQRYALTDAIAETLLQELQQQTQYVELLPRIPSVPTAAEQN